jgi:hypothetical protein
MTRKQTTIVNALTLVPDHTAAIRFLEQIFGYESAILDMDQSTVSTALVDVPGLSVPMEKNTRYEIKALLRIWSSGGDATGTGYGFHFTGPGTPSLTIIVEYTTTASYLISVGALANMDLATSVATPALSFAFGAGVLRAHGTFDTGAGDGNLNLRHLKVTSGISQVLKGSYLRRRKLADL